MIALTAAAGWLLLSLLIGNVWGFVANWRRAKALDEFATELLNDRRRLLAAAKEVREREESLGIFVALNPITRLKTRAEA